MNMQSEPLITVIIPLYNTEDYISECIESIIGQSYSNLDILIVNDASTDNGPAIVEQFQQRDSRIRIINLKENGGVTNARNIGLDNAKGELIAWCDSDDVYYHRFIEIMLNVLYKTDVDFVECQSVTAQKFSIDLFKNIKSNSIKYTIGDKNDFLKRFASHQLQTSLWSKLFRKEAFTNFRFPPNRLYEENLFYFFYSSRLKKAAYITDSLYFYRSRPGSIMKKKGEKEFLEKIHLINDFITFSNSLSPENKSLFTHKILGMLLNLWQLSILVDGSVINKFKWQKRISNMINSLKFNSYENLTKKERILVRVHNCVIFYAAYMFYHKLK